MNEANNAADNMNDITVVMDEEDELSIESDGNDFEAAMKVRKNLSETFDRHASVAEKIARLESKNAAVASMLPPRYAPSTASSALSVSLRIRPPALGHAAAKHHGTLASITSNSANDEQYNTIEILPSSTGLPTTVRTHPPSNSNAGKAVRDSLNAGGVKEFTFQRVFSPETTQYELYSTIAAPLVQGLFPNGSKSGESALLFAYGVTNAGKTFTIMGNSLPDQQSNWGIIPRALQDIIGRLEGTNLQLTMSYMEVYNENVYDLLPDSSTSKMPNFKPTSLKLRESQEGDIYVKDLVKHRVHNVQEGLELAKQATAKRHTSSNNINADSSRSHCICQMELSPQIVESNDGIDDESAKSIKFWIVDLAGSERTKRTGGLRQKEATIINTSLMKLMRCLSVMRENQGSTKAVVPFRESKLTHLFMSHLTGPSASRTSMIVNVNPSACDFDETQHVLGYAVSAKNVLIQPVASKKTTVGGYSLNGHKKQSQISKLVSKYSPKLLGKRKAVDDTNDRDIKRAASKPATTSTLHDRMMQRVTAQTGSSDDALRKEISSLRASLSIAEAEISSLRLTCEEQAQELTSLEENVRAEVSEEMEQHFKSTREDYDRIIENLQNQVKSYPVGARSERKAKMHKAEKMIEELADKVEECEEEMVRMRLEHEAEIERLKNEHETALEEKQNELAQTLATHAKELAAKDVELQRLTDEHAAEIRDLQASKDESTAFYREQIRELEGEQKENGNDNLGDKTCRLPRSRTSKADSESTTAINITKENTRRMPFGAVCENSEEEEDLIFPKKPTPLVDGGFSRPSGRAPRGREWDMQRGAWRLSVSSSFGQ